MAKNDRRKVINIHSNVPNKTPNPSTLELGEIAINTAPGKEFISFKNTSGTPEVVRFSSDRQMADWMEKKEVIPVSGEIVDQNKNTNKSKIKVTLNQKVGDLTPSASTANADSGFRIVMDDYAMIGANPSFSSITAANKSTLNGSTIISGTDLTVKCTSTEISGTNLTETVESKVSNITSEEENIVSRTILVGTENLHISGKTTEVKDGDVSETNKGTTAINHLNKTTLNSSGTVEVNEQQEISVKTPVLNVSGTSTNFTGDTNINGKTNITGEATINGATKINNNLTVTGNTNISGDTTIKGGANISGVTKIDNDLTVTGSTNVSGDTTLKGNVNISGATRIDNNLTVTGNTNVSGDTTLKGNVNISGATRIDNNLTVSGNTYISGATEFGGEVTFNKPITFESSCPDKITSTTINDAICEVLDRSEVTVTGSSRNNNNSNNQFQSYTVKQNNTDRTISIEIANVKTSGATTNAPQTSGTYKTFDVIYSGTSRGTLTVPNVTITSTTSGLGEGILKQYDIMYDGVSRGKIDIPKDFLVKSGSVKTVTEANVPYAGAAVGDKYIELVLNVKDGSSEEQKIYIPAKDLVTDTRYTDSSSIKVTTGYSEGYQTVSADVISVIKGISGLTSTGSLSGGTVNVGHSNSITAGSAKTTSSTVTVTPAGNNINIPVIEYNVHGHITKTGSTNVPLKVNSATTSTAGVVKIATTTGTNNTDTVMTQNAATNAFQASGNYLTGSTKLETENGISANTNNLSAGTKIGLAATGTAGTYYRVVVDKYGRVTSGNTIDKDTNYYTTGLTLTTSTTTNTISVNGNSTAVQGEVTLSAATTSTSGLMSKDDKSKLDGIENGATKVVSSTVSGWGYTKNTGTVTKISTASGITGGDITTSGTIGLATVGTAGTYYRVVVDKYGRVTSGNTTDANNWRPISREGIPFLTANDGKTLSFNESSGITINTDSSTGIITIGTKYSAGRAIGIGTDYKIYFGLPISAGTGTDSIVEGATASKAYGNYSHAEGACAVASGNSSHAEGTNTYAYGSGSHAEGTDVQAHGVNSHAEGSSTRAYGDYSHAEGYQAIVSGNSAHAEGTSTKANGMYSHAEGLYTITNNPSEHASGRYNISSSADTTFGHSGNTLFSVGNGTADNNRKNAFEIRQNGDVYISGVENVINTSDTTRKTVIKNSGTTISNIVDGIGGGAAITSVDSSAISITNSPYGAPGNQSITIKPNSISFVAYQGASGSVVSSNSSSNHILTINSKSIVLNGAVSATSVTASTGFYQSSDINKKENISLVNDEEINAANKTPIKSFTFKDDESKSKFYGVIAQDAEENGIPEVVKIGDDGYKSVDYTSLLILKIAYLEKHCKDLEDRLNKIENKIQD